LGCGFGFWAGEPSGGSRGNLLEGSGGTGGLSHTYRYVFRTVRTPKASLVGEQSKSKARAKQEQIKSKAKVKQKQSKIKARAKQEQSKSRARAKQGNSKARPRETREDAFRSIC